MTAAPQMPESFTVIDYMGEKTLVVRFDDYHSLHRQLARARKDADRQKARIKALGAALVALEKDYEQLKRKRK